MIPEDRLHRPPALTLQEAQMPPAADTPPIEADAEIEALMQQFAPVPNVPERTWHSDSAAMMSLTGCLTVLFLSFGWMAFYTGRSSDAGIEQSLWSYVGQLAASATAFLGSVYFIGIRKHPLGWQAVGMRRVSLGWMIASVVVGFLFMPVNITIVLSLQRMLSFPEIDIVGQSSVSTPEFIGIFLFAAIIVPIAEEVFFRGMLYTWLKESAGLLIALLASSILFGTLHFYFPQVASISILGLICALVYERSGSLIPAIIIHATNNAIAITLAYTTVFEQLPV